MTRRCSHCSNNGHNSRTCPARGGGVRLFGVRLTEGWAAGAMKKSASVGCLPSSAAAASAASPSGDALGDPHRHRSAAAAAAAGASGYASDDPTRASCSSNCRNERKKGVPWTEDEHRMFLMGLQKLGKGDWRGIARNFVVSRTPTQVASHAQKYFIRQSNASRRKRRSSLFDMVPEMPIDQVIPSTHEEQFLPHSPNQQGAYEPIEPSTASHSAEQSESSNQVKNSASELPAFHPALMPVPFWPTSNLTTPAEDEAMAEPHEVVKSIPVAQRHADEVVSMSELRIGEGAAGQIESTALSLKLVGASSSSSKSAFHVNPSIAVPDLNQSNSSPIHAV